MASPQKSSRKNPSPFEAPADSLVKPPVPDIMLAGATSTGNRARQWNRWRERYNPLRGLNIARAVTLFEQYQRGEMADPQWVYYFIEGADADLFAILERREAALLQLDWNIKLVSGKLSRDDDRLKNFDKSLAAEQAAALREAYERIDNLPEATSHLQLATFRGFAMTEKFRNAAGDTYHLELVDQWNMVRDLLRGRWKYNPDAIATTFYALPEENLVDPDDFLIRERDRHVNRIGLVKFIRANLSEKDWDAFIEIYGIPSGVIIGPQGVLPEKEEEYKGAARDISEGGSGYLPNGSTYTPNNMPDGDAPFRPRLDYLSEKLVLAGTGGLLTMLAQSGSGTLAGSAHQESFDMIARAEAKKISSIFQRSFDSEILDEAFPGKPRLAYFEIAANDELDPDKISSQALNFRKAGFKIDVEELSEKSGYQLTEVAVGTDAPEEDPEEDSHEAAKTAKREDGKKIGVGEEEITNRLTKIAVLPEEEMPGAMAAFVARDLPILCNQARPGDSHEAQRLCNRIAGELMLGAVHNGNSNHDRRGRFTFAADDGANIQGGASPYGSGFNPNPLTEAEKAELKKTGDRAIDAVINTGSDAIGAMKRPDNGSISFFYGATGSGAPKHKGAKGVAGIIAKHGEKAARKMPGVIAYGDVGPLYEQGRKQNIRHGIWTAVLALVKDGNSHTWLLNGFRPKEEEEK